LAEKVRSAGLPVSVSVTGTVRELAPGLDLTAYRLVQEGLTNALRHGGNPRRAEVFIEYGEDRLVLAVRDDGQPIPDAASSGDAGTGLLGMRERVAVYNGSLIAGARRGGGFELQATLPLEPA
jgi:signal transduction histidine kinase